MSPPYDHGAQDDPALIRRQIERKAAIEGTSQAEEADS